MRPFVNPARCCPECSSPVPSHVRGGAGEEIATMQRAWFRCPNCRGDWEVRITNDRVTVVPAPEHGR